MNRYTGHGGEVSQTRVSVSKELVWATSPHGDVFLFVFLQASRCPAV